MHTLQPEIKTISEKKFIGVTLPMSLANNRTGELWRTLMPRRREIGNPVSANLYSLQVYDAGYFKGFDANKTFDKWALVEVSSFEVLPEGMRSFELPGGLYAVFHYKGLNTDPTIFQYIFSKWLPESGYVLDQRPHFEVLEKSTKTTIPLRKRKFGYRWQDCELCKAFSSYCNLSLEKRMNFAYE